MSTDEQDSINPDKPEEKGLVHFYQVVTEQTGEDGKPVKEWRFVSPSEYEAKKNEIPALCYATRHPIDWLIEKIKNSGLVFEEEVEEEEKKEEEANNETVSPASQEQEEAKEESKEESKEEAKEESKEEAKVAEEEGGGQNEETKAE